MRRYVRAANVRWEGISIADVKEMDFSPSEFDTFKLRRGDILVVEGSGSATEVGKPAIWDGEIPDCCFQNTLIRIRSEHSLVPFLHRHFQHDARSGAFARSSRGVGIHHIGAKALARWAIALPPLNEQKRIVATIEALQLRSEAAKEALDSIPPQLKKLRQSVLAAAFRGALTKTWRAQNPDVEPAIELLKRIRAKRRARWIEDAAEKGRAKAEAKATKAGKPWFGEDDAKVLEKERAKAAKKYREPEPVDTDGLPALPEGWCWAKLGWLGVDPSRTVQTGPFGAQLHRREFTAEGVPVIAVGNLTGMGFTNKNLYFVDEDKAEHLRRYDVQAGDVLFARSGATLGKVCVAPDFVRDWRMTGHILRARFNTGFVLPDVVMYALAGCPNVVRQVKLGVRGMTRPGYNTRLLEGIALPIPPAGEQVTLVAKVAEAFNQLAEIQELHAKAKARLSSLHQSILAKAFRGELVPQNPNDEPASVLLERIRAQREAAGATKKKRGRQRSRTKGAAAT